MNEANDSDIYVVWERCEDPGEFPKWESQCGVIEQIGFGDNVLYQGFVVENNVPISTNSFASIKQLVKKEYQRTHKLAWAYADYTI